MGPYALVPLPLATISTFIGPRRFSTSFLNLARSPRPGRGPWPRRQTETRGSASAAELSLPAMRNAAAVQRDDDSNSFIPRASIASSGTRPAPQLA